MTLDPVSGRQHCFTLANGFIAAFLWSKAFLRPACLHAFELDMLPLTDEDALHISSELRSRRSAARKRNLKATKPLKAYPKITNCGTTDTDAKAQRTALQQTLQVLELLPSNSTYAKHRRATVQKALDLLDAER